MWISVNNLVERRKCNVEKTCYNMLMRNSVSNHHILVDINEVIHILIHSIIEESRYSQNKSNSHTFIYYLHI